MAQHRVTIAANGRMVLPVRMRQQLDVERGGTVIIRSQDGVIVLEGVGNAISRAQAIVRKFAPNARSVTEEFISERRAESLRD